MARKRRHLLSLLLAIVIIADLLPFQGQAALDGVYFTAANEQLMELTSSTMPFWSGDTLYVSSNLFNGTDLGINYVRNNQMGLAVLYTSHKDLRFDLVDQSVYDKQGNTYAGYAITRSDGVFFPLSLVCSYFGLTWSYTATDTAPLIRVRSSGAILDDRTFIDAASNQMASRYAAYEKKQQQQQPAQQQPAQQPQQQSTQDNTSHNNSTPAVVPETTTTGSVHIAAGQKVYLLIESTDADSTFSVLEQLGNTKATFLLTTEQMENGDLVRALVAEGHEIALIPAARDAADLEAEIKKGQQLLWQAACSWLRLVWFKNNSQSFSQSLENTGCRPVTTVLDHSAYSLHNSARATGLLNIISRYKIDITVFLGSDSSCVGGLSTLLDGLAAAQYSVCPWRATI